MNNKPKLVFVFIMMGLVFSGYLSAVKFFTNTCVFNESCPYFLGYPACWYGFAMYLVMFIVMLLSFLEKLSVKSALQSTVLVSSLGIIFAGRFVVLEVLRSQVTGVLGLSTCAYGLIFYILILIFSVINLKKI